MRLANVWTGHALTLAALLIMLTGCASSSPPAPQPLRPPPLPAIARQPLPPPECTPSCSTALSTELESWLSTPTRPPPPALPASAATTR